MAASLNKLSYEEARNKSNQFKEPSGNKCKRNLIEQLAEIDVPQIGHVKVFLRIKPVSHGSSAELSSAIHVQDEHTLVTLAPKDSHAFKSMKHLSSKSNSYTFSKIFAPQKTQKEIFKGTVAPFIADFIKGIDCLLFAFGPSSAGKTFTMQGSPRSPGLIPTTLDVLFNTLKDNILKEIKYKPFRHHTFLTLSDVNVQKEKLLKETILKWNPKSVQETSYIKSILPESNAFSLGSITEESSSIDYLSSSNDLSLRILSESRVRDKDSIKLPDDLKDLRCSIWVSFAEVYNETVYDLLEYLPGKAPSISKRDKLKLLTDEEGNTFINGLKEVCVTSGDEAYQVMLFGKCNLHFASTKLNHKSSRSHCIFTIKLVQVQNIPDPKSAKISMLTFCDLAGSERIDKTGNVGDRLKEMGNINTSLLVLGRCLNALRNNQDSETKMVVPFRESKLTKIFQNSLTGTGNVAMIVNINQSPLLFDETLNVLKYSAVAQKIVLKPIEIPKPKNSRFSVYVAKKKNRDTTVLLEPSMEGLPVIHSPEDNKNFYVEEIKKLQDEIEFMKKESRYRERDIRRELCNKLTAMVNEERESARKQVDDAERAADEYYSVQMEILKGRDEARLADKKRKRDDEVESSSEMMYSSNHVDSLNDTINGLKSKVDYLDRENSDLKNKMETSNNDCKNLKDLIDDYKLRIETLESANKHMEEMLVQPEVEDDGDRACITNLKDKISKLNHLITEKDAKIKEPEDTLIDATDEYEDLERKCKEYQEEIFKNEATLAEMELKIAELKSNGDNSDDLLAECNLNLEKKDVYIKYLEKALKEAKRVSELQGPNVNSFEEAEREIQLENEAEMATELNECNVKLEGITSDLEIQITELRNEIMEKDFNMEKLECLKESYNNLKIMNDKVIDENGKLKREISVLKFESDMQSVTSNLNSMHIKKPKVEIQEISVQCNLEEKNEIGTAEFCIQCNISGDEDMKVVGELLTWHNLVQESFEAEINELKREYSHLQENTYKNESSFKKLLTEKDDEIMNLQKAYKAILQEKTALDEGASVTASEKAALENRLASLESELRESNKALRGVYEEKKQIEEMRSKLKAQEESKCILQVLKEELEVKRGTIERLINDNQSLRDAIYLKEAKRVSELQGPNVNSFEEAEREIQLENEAEMATELNECNVKLEGITSDLEIQITELRNEIMEKDFNMEKLECLKESYNNLKIMNDKVIDENGKLKREISVLKFESDMQSVTSNLNSMHIKKPKVEIQEISVQCNLEEKNEIGTAEFCIQCNISGDEDMKVVGELLTWHNLVQESFEAEINELKREYSHLQENTYKNESSFKKLLTEKDDEIMNLQKAYKAILQEKTALDEGASVTASEKAALENRLASLESELRESNKALRGVYEEKKQIEEMRSKLKAQEESKCILQVLKEELEVKRGTIERLINDNQSLRDAIYLKDKELMPFSENHAKQFKHYESLLNKTKEENDVHQREEMRLRSLLQIGTPNKYEKSYQLVSNELSQLKKQLAAELCRNCSSRIHIADKKNSNSLNDVRINVSNENIASNIKSSRRRSKSHPSLSLIDYTEYDDDSDYEMEKKKSQRNRKACSAKQFKGLEVNLDDSDRSQMSYTT